MALTLGIVAFVEAKPGKEAEVEAFVKAGAGIVAQEPGTRVWYGFKVDASTFGIFDAFEDEAARQAHWPARSRPRSPRRVRSSSPGTPTSAWSTSSR